MKLIGLTGGIGSGKSTVSAKLAELGAVIVDADAITRELQQPGEPIFNAIVERFGPQVVAPDGTLDRQALADIVFNDKAALADLNQMTHPGVGIAISERVEAQRSTDNVVILDVPLMVESGMYAVSGLIVVDCPPEEAIRRLVAFRGMSETDVKARMARQASREDRLAKADVVIDNSGTPEELDAQIANIWQWIQNQDPTP